MSTKRIILYSLIILLMLSSLLIDAHADESEDILGQLDSILPEEVRDDINVREDGGIPSFGEIFDLCINTVSKALKAPVISLSSLLLVISVSGIFRACSDMITSERLYGIFEMACGISLSLSMLSVCSVSIEALRTFLVRLSDFSLALSPIMTALSISSGSPGSAAVTSVGISVFVAACQSLFSTFFLSLVRIQVALSICSLLGKNVPDLSGITTLIKRIFSLITGFTVMLFCAVCTYQGIISSGVDSISFRTVRFALGNAVPVVGASLGEALRIVSGALTSLRSTVGGAGVCVILLLLIPNTILILVNVGILNVAASVSRMLGLDRECKFLDEIRGVYGNLLAITLSASFMMIFLLSVVSFIPLSIGGV